MTDAAWLWPTGLGVLGLVFGSFIATVAIRWPEGRSALRGRSACDACGRTLRWYELVPVLSWAAQRGKCRSCGERIAPIHLGVELLGGAIGYLAGWIAPDGAGVAGAAFGWLLLALAALDLIAFWLPDVLTGTLAAAGLATGLLGFAPDLEQRLIGGGAGFVLLWAAASAYRALRGREGLGGGDPKLFGAIGLWLGWRALPTVLLAACLVGLLAVIVLRVAGREVRRSDQLPFGVLLAVGAWPVWLFQASA